jgi:hypothetical protein
LLVPLLATFVMVTHDPWATGHRIRSGLDDGLDIVGLGGPDYALKVNDFGEPVHWDPCSPIYFAVNPLYAPSNWQVVVEDALQATADASGFDLRDAGSTRDRDLSPGGRGARSAVLIAWATADENPALAGPTAGYAQIATLADDDGSQAVAGVVWLDADAYAQMPQTGRTEDEVFILAHELGHVLGLDHVDDMDELMYPRYSGQDGFGSGDVDGFAVLHDQPCPGQLSASPSNGSRAAVT